MKVIYISDIPNHPAQLKLAESLDRHGWQHVYIQCQYRGFGTKINELAAYLRGSDDEHFIMLDAFDNYCIGTPFDWDYRVPKTDRVVVSAEKQCYPEVHKAHHFTNPSPWRYVNSGQIYGHRDYFLSLVDRFPCADDYNDQTYYTDLAIGGHVDLDTDCRGFQSIAFEVDGDFTYDIERRLLLNNVTNTKPVFAHGNGRTSMGKVYQL